MIKVRIPTPLRKLTGGQGEVTAQGENIAALIGALEKEYPGIKERLCDELGELRRFVNIYINEEDIRFRQGIQTPVKKGDEVSQLINCGVYVFEKDIFDYIPRMGSSLLEDIFPKLAAEKQLSGFIFSGKWVDVGTPLSYEKAIKEWGEKDSK